jgi:hypothetical protein
MECKICKKEIEKDSLFTYFCKDCSGENKILEKQKQHFIDLIDNFRAGDYDTLADIKWKLKQQLNQPKTKGCGKKFNDFIFGERICGRFEDLKHSDHIILCPDCKKENSKR